MLKDRNNERYRTLKIDNPKVKEKVVDMLGALMFLRGAGFEVNNEKNIMYAAIQKWDENIINEGMRLIQEKKDILFAVN